MPPLCWVSGPSGMGFVPDRRRAVSGSAQGLVPMRNRRVPVTIGAMDQTSETADTPPIAPPDTATSPAPRRLYRSVRDRRVAGVAGGLGTYTNIDPVVFRLAFVVFTLIGGAGLIAYLVAWLVIPPEEGDTAAEAAATWPARPEGVSTAALVAGGLLIAIGLATLIDAPALDVIWPFSWPVVLVAVGLAVLIRSRQSRRGPDSDPLGAPPRPAPPPRPSPPPAPPPAAGGADHPTTPVLYEPHDVIETGLVDEGLDAELRDRDDGLPVDTGREDEPDAPARPRIISATTLTIGVLFLAGGLATLGHLLDWWTLTAVGLLGGGLLICGLGLVSSAWLGHGLLLIPLGLVLAVGTVLAAIADVPLRGGIGDRDYTISDPANLEDEYSLAIGSLHLDLTQLALEEDTELDAEVGIGELIVEVPHDIRVEAEVEAGMGEAIFDMASRTRVESGLGAQIVDSLEPVEAGETAPTLRLHARTGMGQVVIRQIAGAR